MPRKLTKRMLREADVDDLIHATRDSLVAELEYLNTAIAAVEAYMDGTAIRTLGHVKKIARGKERPATSEVKAALRRLRDVWRKGGFPRSVTERMCGKWEYEEFAYHVLVKALTHDVEMVYLTREFVLEKLEFFGDLRLIETWFRVQKPKDDEKASGVDVVVTPRFDFVNRVVAAAEQVLATKDERLAAAVQAPETSDRVRPTNGYIEKD